MEFTKSVSATSTGSNAAMDNVQMILDEIEILEATLAPYEIYHEIVDATNRTSNNPYEKHIIELIVLPVVLEDS